MYLAILVIVYFPRPAGKGFLRSYGKIVRTYRISYSEFRVREKSSRLSGRFCAKFQGLPRQSRVTSCPLSKSAQLMLPSAEIIPGNVVLQIRPRIDDSRRVRARARVPSAKLGYVRHALR